MYQYVYMLVLLSGGRTDSIHPSTLRKCFFNCLLFNYIFYILI